jgi:hypothetical protein
MHACLFTVTDPVTGKRRRTTYRLTVEEARERYVDPEPVPRSLERREVNEHTCGHGQTLGSRRPAVCDGTRTSRRIRARPYRYTQFCQRYVDGAVTLQRSMRQVHRAGEKCFVDFAGQTVRSWTSPAASRIGRTSSSRCWGRPTTLSPARPARSRWPSGSER